MISAGSPDALAAAVGSSATSSWLDVTQARIDLFAEATGDRQWIHVDQARASEGPYGTTIAHGLLTLSLLPEFLAEVMSVGNTAAVVNYGVESARFLAPVPRDSRLRSKVTLTDVSSAAHGIRATLHHDVELDGSQRPALVADTILLFVPDA